MDSQTNINRPFINQALIDECHRAMERMNVLLKTHSVDEIAVMRWRSSTQDSGTEEAQLMLATSLKRDSISVDDLSPAHINLLFNCRYEGESANLYEVLGQEGEIFDFVVPVVYEGYEFFVFGNFMGGTMEDLKSNTYWGMAKPIFINLAVMIAQELAHDGTCNNRTQLTRPNFWVFFIYPYPSILHVFVLQKNLKIH